MVETRTGRGKRQNSSESKAVAGDGTHAKARKRHVGDDAISAGKEKGDNDIDRETKQDDSEMFTVLERGIIYFFFRPKVGKMNPTGIEDAKKLNLVFRPIPIEADMTKTYKEFTELRLIDLPKKKLPQRSGQDSFLTFLPLGNTDFDTISTRFQAKTYETKTRGKRTNPAARSIGEGVYALARRASDDTTHFFYLLTLPEEATSLQKEFGINDHGKFKVYVWNPKYRPAAQVAGFPRAEYPAEILSSMNSKRWVTATPELLSYDNAQMLFVGESGGGASTSEATDTIEESTERDEERIEKIHPDASVMKGLYSSRATLKEEAVNGTWS